MPVARPESSDARVIAHIDMDCFYVQVEQRKHPELRGLPAAVVQYNEWKGGGLIAVSYEARKFGVKRSMRGDDAKEVCPQIQLVQVPVARGKADLNTYRSAGSEVVSILAKKGRCERASIDEVYLDLTDAAEIMLAESPPESLDVIDEETLKSHILGIDIEDGRDSKEKVREWLCRTDADHREKLLACGVIIVAELRMQVLKDTQFTCSAGIAHNKMLAKLTSGMNKPAQQTVVPLSSVSGLLDSLPIKKMKQLGGKLGNFLQTDLGVNTVGDLLQFPEEKLQEHCGINTGTWLWNIARGINGEEVQGRLLPKSHGSGKSFPGPRALKSIASVQHWVNQLCEELNERLCSDLEQNKRMAHTLTLHARAYHKSHESDSHKKFPSKSCPLRYGAPKLQEDAFNLFQAALREYMGSYGTKTQENPYSAWGITALSVSASKIIDIPTGTRSITNYFHGNSKSCSSSKQLSGHFIHDRAPLSPSGSESYSERNSTEPQFDMSEKGNIMEYAVPGLGWEEKKINLRNDQDPSCSSLNDAQDSLTRQDTHVLLSESDRFFGLDQGSPQAESSTKEPMIKKEGRIEPRKNAMKHKIQGMPSILTFFKSQNPSCSTWEQRQVENAQDSAFPIAEGSQFGVDHSSEPIEDGLMMGETQPNSVRNISERNEERREAWGYNIDEIDPSVIDELPPEIQREVKAWLRPHKRPNTVKKKSSIANYFLPSKNR